MNEIANIFGNEDLDYNDALVYDDVDCIINFFQETPI